MALIVPEVKVEDTSASTVEIKPETPAMITPDTSKLRGVALSNADAIPSNWDIQADEDGICATNNITGRTFTGSSEDFSAMLRGE
jgi:hypothetical protein